MAMRFAEALSGESKDSPRRHQGTNKGRPAQRRDQTYGIAEVSAHVGADSIGRIGPALRSHSSFMAVLRDLRVFVVHLGL
jgi:hypothetical protein